MIETIERAGDAAGALGSVRDFGVSLADQQLFAESLARQGASSAANAKTQSNDSANRTAALKQAAYGQPDLAQYKRPDGEPVARTPDERLALGTMLAQDPHLTPKAFARAEDWAQLSDAVYPKVKGDWSKGLRDTQPSNYEDVTDFGQDPRMKGFTQADFQDARSGFHAELFRNTGTGKYVLAFPGSQTETNWVANIEQDLGLNAQQYKQGIRLARRLESVLGDDFEGTTGHSKGGGEAAAAAMAVGKPAITFNAAGLNPKTVEREGVQWDESRITNFRIEGEPLTYKQEEDPFWKLVMKRAAGEQITIKPIDQQGHIIPPGGVPTGALHGIDYVLRAMLVDEKPGNP